MSGVGQVDRGSAETLTQRAELQTHNLSVPGRRRGCEAPLHDIVLIDVFEESCCAVPSAVGGTRESPGNRGNSMTPLTMGGETGCGERDQPARPTPLTPGWVPAPRRSPRFPALGNGARSSAERRATKPVRVRRRPNRVGTGLSRGSVGRSRNSSGSQVSQGPVAIKNRLAAPARRIVVAALSS